MRHGLGDLRLNNFDLLRIGAAIGVLISHSYALTGRPEPGIRGLDLGGACVLVFFGISGFLIAASWDKRPHLATFLSSRILRIFPALAVVLVVSVVGGALASSWHPGDYWTSSLTLLYLPQNLAMWHTAFELPGVFAHNPYPRAVNGSLWTLRSEFHAYLLIALVGLSGIWARPRIRAATLGLIAFACLTLAMKVQIVADANLLLAFLVGSFLYILRDWIPWHWSLVFILLVVWLVVPAGDNGGRWFAAMAIPYIVLYTAYRTRKTARFLHNRDLSYGTYLWAFPIQQCLAAAFPAITPITMIVCSLVLTTPLAAASWFAIERPALKLKRTGGPQPRSSVAV